MAQVRHGRKGRTWRWDATPVFRMGKKKQCGDDEIVQEELGHAAVCFRETAEGGGEDADASGGREDGWLKDGDGGAM